MFSTVELAHLCVFIKATFLDGLHCLYKVIQKLIYKNIVIEELK